MAFKTSAWDAQDARAAEARYSDAPGGRDVALRVYSTRLLGRDPELVLHGGGNTSVKTLVPDLDGTDVSVLCVKGSGWDMAQIAPPGLPAVRLQALLDIARFETLSDEDLVMLQRRALMDPYAPNPSVEAVLHALVPEKFVDHSHANALVALTNQPDGDAIIRDLFPDAVVVPYVMPGFVLARECQAVLQGQGIPHGMILLNHGLFTAADDARDSYEQHIAIIDRCMARIENGPARPFGMARLPQSVAPLADVAPVLRGVLGGAAGGQRWVLDHRTSEDILAFCAGPGLADYATRGNVTPDHSIRIKRYGVVLPAPQAGAMDAFGAAVQQAIAHFRQDYAAYFERNVARSPGGLTMLDPEPRVAYVPGIGLFGIGRTAKEAAICADIAEATVNTITSAERVGRWAPLPEHDIFDVEYWSLEQAKLASIRYAPMAGRVVAVTGAASGLGLATAQAFRAQGAEVAMLDLNAAANAAAGARLGAFAVACDVSDPASVTAAFEAVAQQFGGLDVLVSNAGIALQARMVDTGADGGMAQLDRSLDVNLRGALLCAQAAVAIMQRQGSGGALLFNVSKQALNPGEGFGPYGVSKAALLALMRQLALEHGRDGITANAVNADRIRTGLMTDAMIAERAAARGVDADSYMRGNLLGREVRAEDVAQAFVHLAQADRTTGAVLTVDGGNVAAMVR
ncbi:MAG: bifunctional aldolase/short-chain dehydrogenase [Roseinatronobacter sp.]